ncbi:hypothetical protein PR202_ga17669 [Eleusine coracana subsp. coracana]|uniref:Uncharacterized protein n=1 Tax=Eleusine coracana subsp. coracana TaxID=191504 RepID=A0AAV5CR02_ELECO|nr:hypothetical protein PR202_ga17422 [Eleusine coracana subsp. coracana]GJN00484.1 hypothetical protein PR202_ga17669 [Eleusine coracana subsp. coracana]
MPKERKKGMNYVIILGAWILWKHRNPCVFDNVSPSITAALRMFKDEHHLWCLAGARRMQALGLESAGVLG